MKQGQETNQIWTQEAGTHDTHNRTLTYKAETDFDEPICKQYLDKLELPRISQMDKESLEAPLSLQELHVALKSLQKGKLPGLDQRFSTPVLVPPRSAHFVCFSLHFRPLFYSTVSALRSGLHRIFRHHSSSKRAYMFHSKGIEVCETWI